MNREIARLTKRMRLGRPVESYPVTITSTVIDGTRMQFCTANPADPVQHKHRKGTFYELAELTTLAALFPKGGTFVDIGAHVGNHSLYAATFMQAGTVIPIEPHATAYRLLIQNVLVNGLTDRIDFSRLGCALGAAAGQGAMKANRRKPAATQLKTTGGKIAILRGDDLLADVTPDMIKIDTPGMEMEVLEGLSGLMSRCTPVILVEVAAANDAAFNAWAKKSGYTVAGTTKRNKNDLNYILTAKTAAKTAAKPKTTATKKTTTTRKAATAKKPVTKVKTTTAKKAAPQTTKPRTVKPKTTTAKAVLDKAF